MAVSARPWTGAVPQQQQQHPASRPPLPPLTSAAMLASAASVSLDAYSAPGARSGADGQEEVLDSPCKHGRRRVSLDDTARRSGAIPSFRSYFQ